MKAKSNQSYPVQAFSGREYVRYEWRDVPTGLEEQARGNPYLELLEDENGADEESQASPADSPAESLEQPEPKAEKPAVKKPASRRKKKA
jgi:hypothetical protein